MPPRHFNLHFGQILERAQAGPRRAAAFVGLIEKFLGQDLPLSLTVEGPGIALSLLPDPITDQLADELSTELRHWVAGNALREMDQFLSITLDQCWDALQAARIVVGDNPPDHIWDRIEHRTRVATKHRLVIQAANAWAAAHIDDNQVLETLSDARNLISHGLGVVDAARAPNGTMALQWIRLRVKIETPGGDIYLDETELPIDLEEGGRVVVEGAVAEREFRLGERITISPFELIQIAFYYQSLNERIVQEVQSAARRMGVPFPDVSDEQT